MEEFTFRNVSCSAGSGEGELRAGAEGLAWSGRGGRSVRVPAADVATLQWELLGRAGHQLSVTDKRNERRQVRFGGLTEQALRDVKSFAAAAGVELREMEVATAGHNWGAAAFEGPALAFADAEGRKVFDVPVGTVTQSVVQGKNTVSLMFQDDNADDNEETMVEMRFYVPPGHRVPGAAAHSGSESSDEDEAAVQRMCNQVIRKADIGIDDEAIASFEDLNFTVPRGRFKIEMFPEFFTLHGKTTTYRIRYETISQLFLLEIADNVHMVLVISLDPPIRQGHTAYPHLLVKFRTADEIGLRVNMDEDKLKENYGDKLMPLMRGASYDVVTRVFRALSKKKVIVPGSFKSHYQLPCVRCSLKNNDGYLYLLEKSMFFVRKPPTYIRHAEITSVEFARLNSNSAAKTFDLKVTIQHDPGEHVFSSINRNEFEPLFRFLAETKKLPVINIKASKKALASASGEDGKGGRRRAAAAATHAIGHDPYMSMLDEERDDDGEDDSEEDDEDFDAATSDSDSDEYSEKSRASSSEDEDAGSGSGGGGAGSGSDESRGDGKRKKKAEAAPKKAKKKQKAAADADAPDKKTAAKKKKKKKKSKVKRALSAYMYFIKEMRPKFKEERPEASFTDLGRMAGERWKAMSDADKEPFNKLAAADKERAARDRAALPDDAGDSDDDDSDGGKKKKKRKVKKKREGPKRPLSAYMFFSAAFREEKKDAGMLSKEIMSAAGARWKEMTQVDRAPYLEKAMEAKKQYEVAVKEYKAKVAASGAPAAAAAKAAGSDGDDDGADEDME